MGCWESGWDTAFLLKFTASWGGYDYRLFEKRPEQLDSFLRSHEFDGLNVTIPYKKAVIPYCQELTDQARRIGSVNTILRRPDGTLLGHNTDYEGFRYMLEKAGARIKGRKALVLGSRRSVPHSSGRPG